MFEIPDSSLKYGFANPPAGTHGSRSIMLGDLRALLATCPGQARQADYRRAVEVENVLQKRTETTRRTSFKRLRELYTLAPGVLLFRALRDLWEAEAAAQPLLALLCAVARDPILRSTAEPILGLAQGERVTPKALAEAAGERFPGRYSASVSAGIGRNAASSWQQSGHLVGKLGKTRARAQSRPTSVAYALLLGYLCGVRGEALFGTVWSRLLDAPTQAVREQAFAASQQGWLEYRQAGGLTDVEFSYLLRDEEGSRGEQH